MANIGVTNLISQYHFFEREFWLSYKALEQVVDPIKWNEMKMTLLKSKRIDDKIFLSVSREEYEKKKSEIDSEWKQKNDAAKATGTALHEKIHNMLVTDANSCKTSFGIPTDQYKICATEEFLNSNGLFPEFRIEIPLDETYLLVGIADLIIKDGNNIQIIEYKTDDKIEQHSHFDMAKKKKKTMKYPLSKIEDCNFNHYTLQLSIYAWMLKKLDPDLQITSLQIYHIVNDKLKKIYKCDFLEKEVDKLMNWHLKSINLKRDMEACREIEY